MASMTNSNFEPLGKVRTKIVATLGPASRDPAMLRKLVEAGVDVFRLNFSHGTHDEHTATLQAIRKIGAETGRQLAVLQDLCGPKIRLGDIPGDVVECDFGAEFCLAAERKEGDDPHQLTCTYKTLPDDLEIGQSVLFADGTVAMDVIERGPGWARLKVTLPGRIRSHQGINVPSAALSVAALTEKDLVDLDWTAQHSVEYVGLSFVRQADDITRLREELDRRKIRARIVAKIEKPQAVANLEAIVAEADAVMVARGDLGVEIDVSKVPAMQKQIIAACHKARVPVITATQMLNSMESSSRPTRAEASDVFNAVLDGTDAVMLSGETAIGQYPVEAVATMSQIAREAENLMFSEFHAGAPWTWSVDNWPGANGHDGQRAPLVARAGQVSAGDRRRRRGGQRGLPPAERRTAGGGHAFRPHGACLLEAAQRHADAGPDRRSRGRPGHGPLLGRDRPAHPGALRDRPGAGLGRRMVPGQRPDRLGRSRRHRPRRHPQQSQSQCPARPRGGMIGMSNRRDRTSLECAATSIPGL